MEPETSALLKTWLTPNGIAAFGIWAGIVVMTLVNVVRGRADKRRAVAEENRHEEAMTALKALIAGMETVIERTAPPRPGPAG